MVKDNEDYGFHSEESQIEFDEAMDLFLAKYLKRASTG